MGPWWYASQHTLILKDRLVQTISVVQIIDHRLVSANYQVLGVELSIINQNYVQIDHISYYFPSNKI